MSGRPVRLLTAATVAAAASLLSVSAASASCFSGCGGFSYAAPVAYYTAPVVYSYSYSAPVSYAAPCASPCGYASYGYSSYAYAPRPMYVVNQGPAYTEPVTGAPEDVLDYGYRRASPYYGEGGIRWHRRHWHRGYGYRHRAHFGYRQHYGLRDGYRHHGYRSMRYGVVGPRPIWRGGMHRMHGPRMHGPRMGMHRPRHMHMHRMHHRMHMNRMPGVVHPHHTGPRLP